MFLASSTSAFVGDTQRVMLIEDDEIVAITAERARVIAADGQARERAEILIPGDAAAAERGGHDTYMLKEINEQPEAVSETIARNMGPDTLGAARMFGLGSVTDGDLASVQRVIIVACGTAYHAGLVGRFAIEEWANVPCDVEVASEWRYRKPFVDERTLVVAISQSGETADTLAAVRLARRLGARTIAITNSQGSQITREVDAVLYTHAGLEMGVAATKTFTTQLAVLYLLALHVGEIRGVVTDAECAGADGRGARAAAEAPRLPGGEWRGRGGRRAPSGQALLLLSRAPRRRPGVSGGGVEAQGDRLHPDRGVRRG